MPITDAPPVGARDVPPRAAAAHDDLASRLHAVRERTRLLAAPVSPEDAMVQSMPDASPTKWHLAHTTWFFEKFVLCDLAGHAPVDARWHALFNSYYQGAGPMHDRPRRGMLSRPSLAEVVDYRARIDDALADLLAGGAPTGAARQRIELGLQHEQQHQELLLTDLKHGLSSNPLLPAYREDLPRAGGAGGANGWEAFDEAIVDVGAPRWPAEAPGFAYDLESPRHRVLVGAFRLAHRPVTCGEFREFIHDGGYRSAGLWLSEGWNRARKHGWKRPLHWLDEDREFTLGGVRPIDMEAPVAHLSYYEADAFARWAGARLPTEFEWERAAQGRASDGNFADRGLLQPMGDARAGLRQLFGDVWEWTSSAFSPYPGFRALDGTLGEYNGKFMVSQWVLRGGSCASPADHLRASYRNFFPPWARWQFAGLRLAQDAP